ncbi:histidine kinase [Phytohabitans aurantiacus]|uniref:histidine kinase n=2 Tax=Phytohabitans aurantiacus TaxID=3016789 RepID=A0ABQ5QY96_9ACTN|nr:histidine kinase [Phytohabitans aurantiacus]
MPEPTSTSTVVVMADTAWQALRSKPLRFFASLWPLRTLAYVLSGAVIGALSLVWIPVALVLGAVVAAPALTRPLAALERRRVTLLGGPPPPDPHRRPDRPGPIAWLRFRYREAVTWRELAYLGLHATVLLALDVAALVLLAAPILALGSVNLTVSRTATDPATGVSSDGLDVVVGVLVAVLAGLALLVVAFFAIYAVPLAAIAHAKVARLLLAPGPGETLRLLTRSRARLVDAFEVERRRIERDLHDGAQQRLLALGMTLVGAQLEFDDRPEAARALINQAAEEAKAALAELRELIRGIHPHVLTDLGLPAAVAELVDRASVPVTVALDLPHRLPSTVESAAYFVVAEALSNAAKHASATQIFITGGLTGAHLGVEVRDDGVGGADPGAGTGLAGLADRVDAHGGTLTLSSPPGGPTVLRVELPCA